MIFPPAEARWKIILLTLAALSMRAMFAFTYSDVDYYGGISDGHLEVARNILAGRGAVMTADIAHTWEPPNRVSLPMIDRPLGYPLLICLPLAISSSVAAVKVFQSVLGAISCLLLLSLGRKLFNERIGLIAAWCYALWPISARLETVILADGVMAFFLLSALFVFTQADDVTKSSRRFFLAGLIFGCGTLMRPDISLLPFFLLLGLLLTQGLKAIWKPSAALFGGFVLVIGFHTARNYEVTEGHIIPLGIGNGISLWEGISQFGDTLGTVYGDGRMAEREGYRSWAYPKGIERDRAHFRQALEIILTHPGFYAEMIVKRVGILLKPDGIVMSKFILAPKTFFERNPGATQKDFLLSNVPAVLAQFLLVGLQLVFLLVVAVTILRLRKEHRIVPAASVIVYYIGIHIVTNTEARYFYPALPLVFLFAAAGIDRYLAGRSTTRTVEKPHADTHSR